MELTIITPKADPPYYEGMLAPGILVVIKPAPPSIYFDYHMTLPSRATAQCGILEIKGRSNSLEQAHKDVIEARNRIFPQKLI